MPKETDFYHRCFNYGSVSVSVSVSESESESASAAHRRRPLLWALRMLGSASVCLPRPAPASLRLGAWR